MVKSISGSLVPTMSLQYLSDELKTLREQGLYQKLRVLDEIGRAHV